jgi:1-acyl-sn-glycerol-3-phosphate acyltransferase
MIRTLLAFAFLSVAIVLFLPFLILWSRIVGSPDTMYWFAMKAVASAMRVAKVRIRVEGLEHIPPVACVFASNHASNIDPLVVFPVIPRRVSVLLKKEIGRVPILSTGMRMTQFVFVDRSDRRSAGASLKQAIVFLREGLSFAVYAEGTRSPDGRLRPFKRGAFLMALQAGAPVVPVSLGGTQRLMPKGHWIIQPGEVTVRFGSPIYPRQFTAARPGDLISRAESAVAAGLPPDQQPLPPAAS